MSLTALFPLIGETISSSNGPLSSSADFQVLGLALEAAQLDGAVAASNGFTLFAPTDAAFATLAGELGFDGDPTDANAVFGAIAGALGGLASDGDPIPLLTDILLYHVGTSQQTLAELEAGGDVTTLLTGSGFEVTGGTVVDDDPDAQNGDVIAADVDTGTGLVQVVDQVLLPLDTPVVTDTQTLLDQLKESGGTLDDDLSDFDVLLTALQATGLDTVFDDPTAVLTLFAPNDQAFLTLAQDLGFEGEDESGALQFILDVSAQSDPENPLALVTDVLRYHVLGGEQDIATLQGSASVTTLAGQQISVGATSIADQDPNATDANLTSTDGAASNGILHTVDGVLRPNQLALDAGAEGPDPVAQEGSGGETTVENTAPSAETPPAQMMDDFGNPIPTEPEPAPEPTPVAFDDFGNPIAATPEPPTPDAADDTAAMDDPTAAGSDDDGLGISELALGLGILVLLFGGVGFF